MVLRVPLFKSLYVLEFGENSNGIITDIWLIRKYSGIDYLYVKKFGQSGLDKLLWVFFTPGESNLIHWVYNFSIVIFLLLMGMFLVLVLFFLSFIRSWVDGGYELQSWLRKNEKLFYYIINLFKINTLKKGFKKDAIYLNEGKVLSGLVQHSIFDFYKYLREKESTDEVELYYEMTEDGYYDYDYGLGLSNDSYYDYVFHYRKVYGYRLDSEEVLLDEEEDEEEETRRYVTFLEIFMKKVEKFLRPGDRGVIEDYRDSVEYIERSAIYSSENVGVGRNLKDYTGYFNRRVRYSKLGDVYNLGGRSTRKYLFKDYKVKENVMSTVFRDKKVSIVFYSWSILILMGVFAIGKKVVLFYIGFILLVWLFWLFMISFSCIPEFLDFTTKKNEYSFIGEEHIGHRTGMGGGFIDNFDGDKIRKDNFYYKDRVEKKLNLNKEDFEVGFYKHYMVNKNPKNSFDDICLVYNINPVLSKNLEYEGSNYLFKKINDGGGRMFYGKSKVRLDSLFKMKIRISRLEKWFLSIFGLFFCISGGFVFKDLVSLSHGAYGVFFEMVDFFYSIIEKVKILWFTQEGKPLPIVEVSRLVLPESFLDIVLGFVDFFVEYIILIVISFLIVPQILPWLLIYMRMR